jgi:predicted amidophosphoribosyltransferase
MATHFYPQGTCRRCGKPVIDPPEDRLCRACRIEFSPPPVVCDDCGETFPTRAAFAQHQADGPTGDPHTLP